MPDDKQTAKLLELTSTIISAHVSTNAMPASELPRLIATVHETLGTLGTEEKA
jgi:predicted transcriptional regulator